MEEQYNENNSSIVIYTLIKHQCKNIEQKLTRSWHPLAYYRRLWRRENGPQRLAYPPYQDDNILKHSYIHAEVFMFKFIRRLQTTTYIPRSTEQRTESRVFDPVHPFLSSHKKNIWYHIIPLIRAYQKITYRFRKMSWESTMVDRHRWHRMEGERESTQQLEWHLVGNIIVQFSNVFMA